MSEKSESESQSQHDEKQARKPKALSFDDVMKQASAPPPPPAPKVAASAPAPAPAPEKKSAQPTFEEIMAGVQAPAAGSDAAAARPPEARKSRPPRPREERKMPIVVRKPTLGGDAPAADSAATDAESTPAPERPPRTPKYPPRRNASEQNGESDSAPSAPRPPRREPQPIAESVYAQPGAEEESGDFGAMFAEAQKQRAAQQGKGGKLKPGQRISAKIAHLGAEVAFLDLGGKGEAIIDLGELRNDKGDMVAQIGETVDGYVLSLAEGQVVLTRSVPKGAGREALQQAMDAKVPVEGTVTAHNKGGLEVDLGGTRAFLPASQVDIRFHDDLGTFVGQKLQFLVMEMRGGNAILSRRALLEEERKGKALELRKTLEVGATLEGTITGVRDFGAFVDLGGIEGLIHVSELSHQRVAHAQDAVKQGQKVRVQVLRIEKDEKGVERIALSLRALEQDPWDAARPSLQEGQTLTGKVVRLQPFGAFVELFPGVDGLVHVSALANKHVQHPREVVKEGETIEVQIDSIDDAQRRVSLRRIVDGAPAGSATGAGAGAAEPRESRERKGGAAGAPAAPRAKRSGVGDVVDATVDRCELYGVFVKWEGGKGLVPNPELGTPRGSDNKKVMPIGTTFKATILEIDEKGRYRLSKTAAEHAADRVDYDTYRKSIPAKGKGFGTLGDLLRAKMQPAADEE
jgi:small subunit ribosomal protein S1